MMRIAGYRPVPVASRTWDRLNEPDEPLFQSQCAQLRNNDADTVKVCAQSVFKGYGFRLGHALLDNTVVERVDLSLDCFFSDSENKQIEAAPMLEYIRSSQALHSVALFGHIGPDDFGLGGQILEAVASNPFVKSVRVDCYLRVQDFLHLVSNAPHVCSLFIGSFTVIPLFHANVSDTDRGAIFDALADNTNLERLSLDCVFMPTFWAEQVLSRLRSHCRLRHLEIHCWLEPDVLHVQNVLVSSTALESLYLKTVSFDLEASELLCEGLRSNRTSCRMLSLRDCRFTAEATNNMITFFQRDANRTPCVLSEVHLYTLEGIFQGSEVRHVIRAMLSGSALNKFALTLHEHSDLVANLAANLAESLFHELSQHAGEIRVPSLQFQFNSPTKAEMVALCSFLRATATLQDVRVSACASSSGRILSALRQNGSLLRAGFFENRSVEMSLGGCFEFPFGASIFDETEQARAEMYLKRNEMVPQMVVAPGAVDNNAANIATGEPNLARELFVVATHAPRTAPNTILRGLNADWAKSVGSA